MTEQDKIWFENLVKDREDSAKTLAKHSMRGVKKSVVEKYSDQAHFIYELLQNADDAKATSASFELQKDGLCFKHNGNVHFTVSNPESEEDASNKNCLGHINSITSVGSSSKNDQSTIGKFGVGFKAVFQYTETPHIYDRDFQFKIENFIVPVKIENDFPERNSNETVFYFPFNKPEMPKGKAYIDILGKLKSLNYPILFLSNLESVGWNADNETGTYSQRIIGKPKEQDDISYKKLEITQQTGLDIKNEKLLLLSRKLEDNPHTYSVGFFLNPQNKLIAKQMPAFCFFPTKETTTLNFIIHTPFLLTDSREGIKRSEKHNEEMIDLLAELAADSLLILKDLKLIDDNIINIIPYKESNFYTKNYYNSITSKSFFSPFYEKIKEKFLEEDLLPVDSNEFVGKENSIWAAAANLPELFNNKQLALLFGNENVRWVFTSFGYQNTQNIDKEKASYLSEITASRPFPKDMLTKINCEFINQQTFEWLHKLYEYLSTNASYKDDVKTKPIFKDTEGNAVWAFEYDNSTKQHHPVLFLATEDENSSFKTIHESLLLNKTSKEFILNFGIKEPDLKDEIYNHILPLYDEDGEIDTENHFKKFFKYYKENYGNKSEIKKFIDLIKDKEFVLYKTKENETTYHGEANTIYYPSPDLQKYFETKPDARFVDLEDYYKQIDKDDRELLKEFLLRLGASELPRIIENETIDQFIDMLKRDRPIHNRRYDFTTKLKTFNIDGMLDCIKKINKENSLFVWKLILKYNEYWKGKLEYATGTYTTDYESIPSRFILLLGKNKWLLANDGLFVAPHEITVNDLAEDYARNRELEELLGFKPLVVLTEEQRKLELTKGRSEEEIKKAFELYDRQNAPRSSSGSNNSNYNDSDNSNDDYESKTPTERAIREIKKKIAEKQNTPHNQVIENQADEEDELKDEDSYTKPAIDFDKKRKKLEDKAATEIDELTKIEELTEIANNSEKYSFSWFKALLQLELLNSNENSTSRNKDISITFGKIEKGTGTSRTLILTQPNRYIPQHIEEFSGVPLKIELQNGETRSIEMENFSVKEYTLKAKIKSTNEIDGLNFAQIKEGTINVKNAGFLLDALVKCFNSFKFNNENNLKENLPQYIEFVLGPPGTGKTTHLATQVLIPLMKQSENCKVLVLAPTNKAADILTKRIMEKDLSKQYKDYLVRFGTTSDETIEKESLVKDRSFNLATLSQSVVVSTMARFTYDTFFNGFGHNPLYDFKWDYIVIDEASMLHLPNIIFTLYRQKPKKFIVAGDPFQIGPIAQVKQWKDENIYTMVELDKPDSFANPQPQPHNFTVTKLEKQWRSIESIGKLFSKLTYNGILEHNRKNEDIGKIETPDFNVKPLTFIKFPVSKYESIYRSKRLQSSNYHIYSAIFAFEFVKYLANNITLGTETEKYKIGIISPYRIQADIVNKLITSVQIPKNIDIQVGTVHGFQGDECKIIISLFNTPPYISTSPESFVNKQNILNVAISRAEDYLFVLMPDANTEKIENLLKIRKIEKLSEDDSSNFLIYNSAEIEELIMGGSNYIESVTFSTTHQNVNVYSEVEKIYEVRDDDSAIDIQLGIPPSHLRKKFL